MLYVIICAVCMWGGFFAGSNTLCQIKFNKLNFEDIEFVGSLDIYGDGFYNGALLGFFETKSCFTLRHWKNISKYKEKIISINLRRSFG